MIQHRHHTAMILFGAVLVAAVGVVLVLNSGAGTQAVPAEPRRLVEPAVAQLTGLDEAWADLRIDKLSNAIQSAVSSPRVGELGGPRDGLPWRQSIDFFDGKRAFEHQFTAKEGLGPVFNDVSCGSCHRASAIGGGGLNMGDGITVHGPPETGGDAMGVRKSAIGGHSKEVAIGKVARLRTPPLFGLGELDRIDDAVIDANVDKGDSNRDGIVGLRGQRYGDNGKRGPTRFGQKANEWNLRRFVAGALFDEMGVSSTVRRNPVADNDEVKDPEVTVAFIDRLDAYVRNLARPPRGAITKKVSEGEQLFGAIGCTGCHRPSLGGVAGAYTDLLLHDMGPLLDSGIKDGLATGRHWRTMPLWGVRFRSRYLHDERAGSYDEVLAQHRGEAEKPALAYQALPAASRKLIAAFLNSL